MLTQGQGGLLSLGLARLASSLKVPDPQSSAGHLVLQQPTDAIACTRAVGASWLLQHCRALRRSLASLRGCSVQSCF